MSLAHCSFFFFFFNDTATTEIYTLSLHDALPILRIRVAECTSGPRGLSAEPEQWVRRSCCCTTRWAVLSCGAISRSEEHTSELQSQSNLVCRLLLEKKKKRSSNTRNGAVSSKHRP